MSLKINKFSGIGNVTNFIEKIDLLASLKDYDEEKQAKLLASYLDDAAFDVYMRLPADDRKNPNKIKDELLKEFNKGQVNREAAIKELKERTLKPGEPFATFSYKIEELMKLAYPDFNEVVRTTIAKDYFVNALSCEMQTALKSIADYSSKSLSDLVTETTRLELAGVKARIPTKDNVLQISEEDEMVNTVTKRVMEGMSALNVDGTKPENVHANLNYVASGGNRSTNTSSSRRGRDNSSYNKQRRGGNQTMKCRSCQSVGHGYRSCPSRFCQACGQRGHDAWNESRKNYSL